MARNSGSWVLLVLAIACLVVALFPQWDESVDPTTGERVSERRLGLWFSPLHQTVRRDAPHGGFSFYATIHWLSWSSLLALVGVGCLGAFRQRWHAAAPDRS